MEDEWKRGNRISEQKEEGSKSEKRVSEEKRDGQGKGVGGAKRRFLFVNKPKRKRVRVALPEPTRLIILSLEEKS